MTAYRIVNHAGDEWLRLDDSSTTDVSQARVFAYMSTAALRILKTPDGVARWTVEPCTVDQVA